MKILFECCHPFSFRVGGPELGIDLNITISPKSAIEGDGKDKKSL